LKPPLDRSEWGLAICAAGSTQSVSDRSESKFSENSRWVLRKKLFSKAKSFWLPSGSGGHEKMAIKDFIVIGAEPRELKAARELQTPGVEWPLSVFET